MAIEPEAISPCSSLPTSSCSHFQVGSFPNWDIWAEWNGKYRDDVRKFVKGDAGMKGALATRLAGSADLYKVRGRDGGGREGRG